MRIWVARIRDQGQGVGGEGAATGTAEFITIAEAVPRHVAAITAAITSQITLVKILRCISTKPFPRLFAGVLTRLTANVFLAAFDSLCVIEGLPIAGHESLRATAFGSAPIAGFQRDGKGLNLVVRRLRPRRDRQVFVR